MGEKVQGIRSINGRYKIDGGEVKNSIGNGEAKDMYAHGHELRGGLLEGMGIPGRGEQRGKNWGNCNSIINKIYIFKKRMIPFFIPALQFRITNRLGTS